MNEIRYTAVVAQNISAGKTTIQTGNNIVTNTMQTLYFFGRGNSSKCLKCEAKQAKSCLQFANVFAACFCAVHTHQLGFANTSLPT